MPEQKDLQSASDARDKNLDPLDLAYNGSLIEDEALGAMEYIAFDDLERFELPSELRKYYLWEKVDPLDIAKQHDILRQKDFVLPCHWYEEPDDSQEDRYDARVSNSYYVASLLPLIGIAATEESVRDKKRALRTINSKIDQRVLGDSGQKVRLFEYLQGENKKVLLVNEAEMMEILDVVLKRFIKED